MTGRPEGIDLAAGRLGGAALVASDDFFAPKENLLKPGRGVFLPDEYTDRGKWMDGWETRRRRGPGHDWCIIRLGVPGRITAVTVDTHHFKGNHPEACSLDAGAFPDAFDPGRPPAAGWSEIVPRRPLTGDTEHTFPVSDETRSTHVRFNIYPDGGVARLRIWGEALPDWDRLSAGGAPVDLASALVGGRPLECSDAFFSQPLNLLMPDPPANMGDGWETRRRRGPGHDWVVIRLGRRGAVEALDVDTTHFKGNFPESCGVDLRDGADAGWRELLPRTALRADTAHRFERELATAGPGTHVRLNIYPDGGVARFRVWGRPAP